MVKQVHSSEVWTEPYCQYTPKWAGIEGQLVFVYFSFLIKCVLVDYDLNLVCLHSQEFKGERAKKKKKKRIEFIVTNLYAFFRHKPVVLQCATLDNVLIFCTFIKICLYTCNVLTSSWTYLFFFLFQIIHHHHVWVHRV